MADADQANQSVDRDPSGAADVALAGAGPTPGLRTDGVEDGRAGRPSMTKPRSGRVRIAVIRRRRWGEAAEAAGHDWVDIPPPPTVGYFDSTLEDRIAHGRRVFAMLKNEPVDLILDAYGDGMLFIDDPRQKGMSAMLHYGLGVPLVSHWTETFRILFKRMDPALVLEALQSPTWFKGVFTRAHLAEMTWMGIPGCFHLPLAADDFSYSTDAPSVDASGPKVFFAGSQQSRYFSHADGVDVRTQWPGAMALAAVADGSASSFLDAYRRYELGPCPASQAAPGDQAEAVRRYYAHKMFFAASRNLATRDRFVYFLQKKLGSDFLFVGNARWSEAYGLTARPRVDQPTYDNLIRRTPICVNMVNGDNDSGLNMRHFEITALGGFLLSYHHAELDEMFEVGRECAAFHNETELVDKIGYYLNHPEERAAIARAGQQRALGGHLLRHRLEAALSWLRKGGHL